MPAPTPQLPSARLSSAAPRAALRAHARHRLRVARSLARSLARPLAITLAIFAVYALAFMGLLTLLLETAL